MKDNRKDLRIRLPEHARQGFDAAKLKAERELGISLRDNEFAARVLVQAVKKQPDKAVTPPAPDFVTDN